MADKTDKSNTKQKVSEFVQIKMTEIAKLDADLRKFKIPVVLLERLKKEFDESHSLSNELGKTVIMPNYK